MTGFAASTTLTRGTGGGGGATWATTGRLRTFSGGFALGAAGAAPTTLACTGATGATAAAGACANISRLTRTLSLATGLDCAKAAASTAITAPGTCRLA